MASANQQLFDEAMARAVQLARYERGLVRKVIDLLEDARKDIEKRLLEDDGDLDRLADLQKEITRINRAAYAAMGEPLKEELEGLAEVEIDDGYEELRTLLPAHVNLVAPDVRTLAQAVLDDPVWGADIDDWIDNLGVNASFDIMRNVRLGLVEGQGMAEITRGIVGTKKNKYRDGIGEIHRRHVETIVRTAVQSVANRARQTVYNDNADILKGLRWTSTLDSRTSGQCRALDGQVFPVDDGPRPPLHPRCRSTMVPMLKRWDELGIDPDDTATRASMDGQVPTKTDYDKWLRAQVDTPGRGREFVYGIMGEKRGKLFLDGKLHARHFIDEEYEELDLVELKKRYRSAWQKAGLD